MVLQLVFDPLAYLQYSALPDHRPGPAAFYQSPGASNLVPGLVAEDHAEHHVHGGCGGVSCCSAPLLCMRGRTAAGSDQSGVVGVEHDLGARALLFMFCQHAALSVWVFRSRARCASVSNVFALPRTLVYQPTFCHCLRPSWFWWSLCHAGTLFLR